MKPIENVTLSLPTESSLRQFHTTANRLSLRGNQF